MNKIFFTTVFLTAAMSASAQTSISDFLNKFPTIPSAQKVIEFDKKCRQQSDGDKPTTLSDFVQSAEKTEQEIVAQLGETDKTRLTQVAASTLSENVQGLNITKGQMSKMSQEQQQAAAMQSAMSMLSDMGVSASDVAKMRNGTMTEAEQQALTNNIMKKATGGVSVDDIKRMENMTDAQRAAYMQQKGMTQKPTAPKGKVSSQLALRLQAVQSKGNETHQKSLQMSQLKETIASGESLWKQKYADNYKKLHAEFQGLIAATSDNFNLTQEQRKANDARIESVKKQMFDMESSFYAEYIPKYLAAIQDGLNYVRNTEAPSFDEWKKAYDEAYQQTGENRWIMAASNASLPISTYSLLLQKIQNYNLNSKGETFESSALE
ncbi:MAG: hypothetical protein E7070_05025 [Bacteroidales bacterium]|jgi:hypothetical protein|nr:hypothetical protein [Bacteroidales bacterium]